MSICIQKACEHDLEALLPIYERAKHWMIQQGNPQQWSAAYPGRTDLLADLALDQLYVIREGSTYLGAFCLSFSEEDAYRHIRAGQWLTSAPYGVIHRLVSAGLRPGIAQACFAFCAEKITNLRTDTHAQNLPMQKALRLFGFRYAGQIQLADGSPRLAFEWSGPNSI